MIDARAYPEDTRRWGRATGVVLLWIAADAEGARQLARVVADQLATLSGD